MGWSDILKKTFKLITYPLRHPVDFAKGGATVAKVGVTGAGVGYLGWQTLVKGKSVTRTVSDVVIGSDNVDALVEKTGAVVDGVSSVTRSASEAISGVSNAMSGGEGGQQGGIFGGMANFLQSLFSGNGGNMIGDFFHNIGEGKVSGMSLAGLIGAAFLIFGRFGWFGKIAGALLAMMLLGNNIDMSKVVGGQGGQGQAEELKDASEDKGKKQDGKAEEQNIEEQSEGEALPIVHRMR